MTGRNEPRRFHLSAALAIAIVGAAFGCRGQTDPDGLLVRAQAAARSGRFDLAGAFLQDLSRLRPPTPDDLLLRAQVAGASERVDEAVAALAAIPDAHPLGPLARLSQGQLEARRGRLRPAEAAFLRTLELLPACAQARRELVYIDSVRHRFDRLDEQLSALDDVGQLDRTHLLHWGRVRHVAWSPAADLTPLERYVAADPDDNDSRIALADALARLGRLDDAEAALAPLPDSVPDARLVRVQIAEARSDPTKLEALLADAPDDHPALARIRAQHALARRDLSAATRLFRASLDRDPHDRAALNGLAMALTLAGDEAAARPIREKVRLFDRVGTLIAEADARPDEDPALPRRLGLACSELGRKGEARAWLRRAIARDPLDAEAQKALYNLSR